MSTVIGGLLMPQFQPFDYGQQMNRGILGATQQVQGQTSLLALQEAKQKQEAEARMLLAIQNDPLLRERLFGGSILGSLQTAPGGPGGMPAPGPGPITQSPLGGGGGPSQQIPAYPDASRFAGVPPTGGGPIPPNVMGQAMPTVTPPQGPPSVPTLASLGPQQGPGQMQAPQNPLLEMARRDPRVAMMLQQQMEKTFTTQLTMREKTAEAFATKLQGVNSQESYETAVQDLMQWAPQQASRLPKVWSKEAMQPIIDSALSAKDKVTLQIAEIKEQTDLRTQMFKERQAAGTIPEYVKGEGPLNAWVDTLMQEAGLPRGTNPPPAILRQAQQNVQEGKVAVSAAQGQGQLKDTSLGVTRIGKDNKVEFVRGPNGEILQPKPSETEQKGATLANSVAAANKLATELEDKGYKPSVWEKGIDKLPLGLGNYVTSSDYQKYRQTVREFASAWLYGVSGAQITDSEWENANQTFFPQPNEDKGAVELKRQRRAALVEQLRQQSQATGRTGTQTPPTSQGSAKPVSQMNAEETRAEIAAIKARGGK